MQVFSKTPINHPQPCSSKVEDNNHRSDTKILWIQQAISCLIVLVGLGYLVLVPADAVKKRLEPVDAGILVAIILTNSGIIPRLTKISVGKDGIEAIIDEKVNSSKEEVTQKIEDLKTKYELEQQYDLELLREIDLHLSGTILQKSTVQRLKDLMEKASPAISEYVYQKTKDFRHRISAEKRAATSRGGTYNKKGEIDRTIEVFQALIESNHVNKRHRFYAQLGYALKDKDKSDWRAAEINLNKAIDAWKKENGEGSELPPYYCFNWIVCIVEIASKYGFKIEYDSAQKNLIRERLEAATNCPQLVEALQGGEYNGFKHVFERWSQAQAPWLDVDAIIHSSKGSCYREPELVLTR